MVNPDGRITFRAANHRPHNTVLIFQWSKRTRTHTSYASGPSRDIREHPRRARYIYTVQRRPRERESTASSTGPWRPRRYSVGAQWRNLHGCKRFSFHASYAGMTGSQSARPPTLPQASTPTIPPPFSPSPPLTLSLSFETLFARLFLPPVIYPGMHHRTPRVCPAATRRAEVDNDSETMHLTYNLVSEFLKFLCVSHSASQTSETMTARMEYFLIGNLNFFYNKFERLSDMQIQTQIRKELIRGATKLFLIIMSIAKNLEWITKIKFFIPADSFP